MKKHSVFSLLIVFLIFLGSTAYAQLDTCYQLVTEHQPCSGIYNPDSLMVDTCSGNQTVYARKWYRIIFFQDPFNIPEGDPDTTITRNWIDIDTNLTDLRNMLDSVESIFGSYYFKKCFPHITDTSLLSCKCYEIEFEEYCDSDSLSNFIHSFEMIYKFYLLYSAAKEVTNKSPSFLNEPSLATGIMRPWYPDENTKNNIFRYLNTDKTAYHKLSHQWNIYAMRCPMAWEMTKGNDEVVIDFHDFWNNKYQNWDKQTTNTNNAFHSTFTFDFNRGWVAGEHLVLNTTNGGLDWDKQLDFGTTFYSIYFINENTGWVAGDRYIYKTTNSGDDWEKCIDNDGDYNVKSIYFIDSDNGWVVGDDGTKCLLAKSTDGGYNWTDKELYCPNTTLNCVFFIDGDSDNGWVAGDKGKILRTTNGGDTWVDISMTNANITLNSIYFIDSDNGWVVGNHGNYCCIYKTTNGGIQWELQLDDYSGTINSVKFSDSQNGIAVNSNGKIFTTLNGGEHWYDDDSGFNNLTSIAYNAESNSGWMVGESGTIIKISIGWLEPKFGIGKGLEQDLINKDPLYLYPDDLYMKVHNRDSQGSGILNGTEGGNVIYNQNIPNNATMYTTDPGNGTVPLIKIYPSHGLECMATAISKLSEYGIVGVCPSCCAVGTNKDSELNDIDIDGKDDPILYKQPDIISSSVIYTVNKPTFLSRGTISN